MGDRRSLVGDAGEQILGCHGHVDPAEGDYYTPGDPGPGTGYTIDNYGVH